MILKVAMDGNPKTKVSWLYEEADRFITHRVEYKYLHDIIKDYSYCGEKEPEPTETVLAIKVMREKQCLNIVIPVNKGMAFLMSDEGKTIDKLL